MNDINQKYASHLLNKTEQNSMTHANPVLIDDNAELPHIAKKLHVNQK